MRKVLLLAVIVLSVIGIAFSAQYSSTVTPSSVDGGQHNVLFNFTVTNLNSSVNITHVNITLPSGFTYVLNSNGTNVSSSLGVFTNISSTRLSWTNSSSVGIIRMGGTAVFWFNASFTGVNNDSTASFNVSILDNQSQLNATRLANVTVIPVAWAGAPGQFYLKPPAIRINWTNGFSWNITVVANLSNVPSIIVKIDNTTTTVTANYSQSNSFTECDPMRFMVKNSTGAYTTNSSSLAPGASDNLTLEIFTKCAPGRYYGQVNVSNATLSSNYSFVNVTVDVPITTSNTLNNTTGLATFKGVIPAVAATYQSFYFNVSNFTNVSNIRVNITWSGSSKDLDMFLLDGTGVLRGRSNARVTTTEDIVVNNVTTGEVWEFRIYGNESSTIDYSSTGGFVILSSLNVTKNDNSPSIDFGTVNISNVSTAILVLKNRNDAINYTSVEESKELYNFKEFGGSGANNFTVTVANSSVFSKIRASVNWTGGSNYTIRVWDGSKALIEMSQSKSYISNKSDVESEEFIESTSPSHGVWTIEIKNNTVTANNYNVSIKLYVANTSEWFQSNWSTSNITQLGTADATKPVQFNLTTPRNALDGFYIGRVVYTTSTGVTSIIPLKLNLTSQQLMVNGTFGATTVGIDDNIGFERAYAVRTLTVKINNTGAIPLNITSNLSTERLNLTTDSSKYIDFNFSYPTSLISAGGSDELSINFTINTTRTGNTSGIYRGWIFLNATNSTPYTYFNLTVEVNLSADLKVMIREARAPFTTGCTAGDSLIENASQANNVSVCAQIYFRNSSGSGSDDINSINFVSNFTAGFIHLNESSFNFAATSITNASNPLYLDSRYKINATAPAGMPGGPYVVNMTVKHIVNGITYSGTGNNTSAVVWYNNTGIKMNVSSTSISVDENTNSKINVTVVNYGLMASSRKLLISSDSSNAVVDENTLFKNGGSAGDCGSTLGDGGTGFTQTVDSNGTETCQFEFKITGAANVTGDKTVTVTVKSDDATFGNLSLTVTVKDKDSSSGGGSSDKGGNQGGNQDTTTNTTTTKNLTLNITSSTISLLQGTNGKVDVIVSNKGSAVENNLKLTLSGIDSSWYTIAPASYSTILASGDKIFTVSFNIPASATVLEYTVTATAKSDGAEKAGTFKLRVLPTEQSKSAINQSYSNISDVVKQLETQISDLKSQGFNTTSLETELSDLKSKISNAGNNLNSGDYVGANQLLTEAATIVERIKNGIKNASKSDSVLGGSVVLYSVIAVAVIAVIGVMAYMMLPPSQRPIGTKPVWSTQPPEQKYQYKPPQKSLVERLKELFTKK